MGRAPPLKTPHPQRGLEDEDNLKINVWVRGIEVEAWDPQRTTKTPQNGLCTFVSRSPIHAEEPGQTRDQTPVSCISCNGRWVLHH